MNVKNRILLFIGVICCIITFGLFVYPTMYKYDKLEQKYPVKINRITGETKVLYKTGWKKISNQNQPEKKKTTYKIPVGTTMNDVRALLGEPLRTYEYGDSGVTWDYSELNVYFENGRVVKVYQ